MAKVKLKLRRAELVRGERKEVSARTVAMWGRNWWVAGTDKDFAHVRTPRSDGPMTGPKSYGFVDESLIAHRREEHFKLRARENRRLHSSAQQQADPGVVQRGQGYESLLSAAVPIATRDRAD